MWHLTNAVPLDKLLHYFGCGKIKKMKVPKQSRNPSPKQTWRFGFHH
jgi:hypothetical protein